MHCIHRDKKLRAKGRGSVVINLSRGRFTERDGDFVRALFAEVLQGWGLVLNFFFLFALSFFRVVVFVRGIGESRGRIKKENERGKKKKI